MSRASYHFFQDNACLCQVYDCLLLSVRHSITSFFQVCISLLRSFAVIASDMSIIFCLMSKYWVASCLIMTAILSCFQSEISSLFMMRWAAESINFSDTFMICCQLINCCLWHYCKLKIVVNLNLSLWLLTVKLEVSFAWNEIVCENSVCVINIRTAEIRYLKIKLRLKNQNKCWFKNDCTYFVILSANVIFVTVIDCLNAECFMFLNMICWCLHSSCIYNNIKVFF